ncbi:MAG: DinB family protein [Ignavibacteriaceae bacterium]
MKKINWVDKKFQFDLSQDLYDSVLAMLKRTPDKIAQLVSSLPGELSRKRINDGWSIKENIGHLIDLEELHDGRIDDFLGGKEVLRAADMSNKKTEVANHNSKKINDLLEHLKIKREHFVKRLKHLDQENLLRKSIHPRLNQAMRPIDMAQFVLEHDEHHIQTIKELIAKLQ